MKKSFLLSIIAFLLSGQHVEAQNTRCSDPDPFCVTYDVQSFNINSNGNGASTVDPGNDYGCLTTSPSPSWFYLQIKDSGDLHMFMNGYDAANVPVDVDFILYGPFNNLAAAKADCGNYGVPFTGTDQIVDCSYDPTSFENIDITGAVSGQVYIMLITGYDPRSFSYTIEKTGGTATTDCSIINTGNCGETIYDIGGPNGNYVNDMDAVTVFCPSEVGGTVSLNFLSFSIENCCDRLYIYDGNSTSANLIGVYKGTTSPGIVTSSLGGGGCITTRFVTNSSIVSSGYSYSVTCNPINCIPIPPTAATANKNTFCAGAAEVITLSTLGGEGEKLMWYKNACGGGVPIGVGPSINTDIPAASTSYFVRWETAFCGVSTCLEVPITIHPSPSPVIVGDPIVCSDSSIHFSTANTGNIFQWDFNTSGTGTITDGQGTNAITVNAGSNGGVVVLTETNDASCPKTVSLLVTILTPSNPPANAGVDKNTCYHTLQLAADKHVGNWTTKSGSGNFSPDANAYNATVAGLSFGVNEFIWTTIGRCGFTSKDSVTIVVRDYSMEVEAYSTPSVVCIGSPKELNVTVSGTDGSGNYSYVWTSSDNSFTHTSEKPSTTVHPVSTNTIYYLTLQDNIYEGCTSEDTVVVHAVGTQELVVPSLITPNGDEYNQYLEVKDIYNQHLFPGANLEILNQWGDRVYLNSSYDNTFEGVNLSDGIYYYNLTSGCGDKTYKGWVQIIR